MANAVRFYQHMGPAYYLAVDTWARDCRYTEDYLRFCEMRMVVPLSEKHFNHIAKVCDKQYLKDTLDRARQTRRF